MSDEDKKGNSHREEWKRRSREYQAQKDAERIRAEHERQRNIAQRLGRIVDPTAKEILEEEQKVQSIARQQSESDKNPNINRESQKAARLERQQERAAQRKVKQEQRQLRRVQKLARRERTKKARRHVIRLVPVFLLFTFVTIVSAYFISPYSKLKEFRVTGNDHQDQRVLVAATQVDPRDYTLTVLQNRNTYERRIKKASPWVRQVSVGYQFPTTFPIQVEEYAIMAYQIEKGKAFPILANGEKITESIEESAIPRDSIRTQLQGDNLYKQLSEQLLQLDQEIRSGIISIRSTPSKASEDLVTVEMQDGNQVLVPLSEFSRKLTYYPSIVKDVKEPTTIDMEAGAYGFPTASEEEASQESSGEDAPTQGQTQSSVTQN
ncbi:FtsQ-type POTRA domain-containing protein [Streptococcus sp. 121]|uniref:FtsQ-type POTRA domain-containing protein n=1 Tax=Streptococcus sp. 121 TaxID=2797637 RepID=UPI0018F0ABB9|nr:FtsQ-type POTRA domain-containing protein [Streptococcus sp. 121]MBJ6744993.1 FtsQ-type POTRA domain-containing protein [Streptococcus sp. 121]